MQPIYRNNDFVAVDGLNRGNSDAYIDHREGMAVTEKVFECGLCLPSDNKMTEEQQDAVIEIIRRCFS